MTMHLSRPTPQPLAVRARAWRQRGRARPQVHAGRSLAAALALVGVMLFAQGLGLVHRVVHGSLPTAAVHVAAAGGAGEAQHATAHSGHRHGLFEEHREGGAECRLLDQLVHADALLATLVPAPIVPPAVAPASVTPATPAHRHTALYRARAPPHG